MFVQELRAPDAGALIGAFAAVPYNITHHIVLPPPSPPSALLTIGTAMFVHAGITHIALNMLFLFAFGPPIESLCGHVRFAALYFCCGFAGELAQISTGPGSHLPAIGASGAIAGVLGAYIVSFPTSLVFRLPAVLVIGVWAAAQFVNGFGQLSTPRTGGVAYFSHIGGFCCGVLLIGFLRRPNAGMRRRAW